MRLGVAIPAAVLLLSTGCMVGPDYKVPEAEINASWVEGADARVVSGEVEPVAWWKSFNDPVLDSLIEEAYRQNLSLRTAAVRVLQAMAQRGIAVGELFPQSQEASGSFTREKLSENPPTPLRYANNWFLGFDAAWELDFWGTYRRSIEASDAELDASLASYDDVMVSLVSEVAATYIQIRTRQMILSISEENVKIQEKSLALAESRFKNGATSELDVAQAKTVLEQTRASVPTLRAEVREFMYQLNLLLGSPPRDLLERIGQRDSIPAPPPRIAVGIPADLLRRRPDIRVAERQAAAQCARIGVAEAGLYPSFFLSGTLGLQSDDTGDLFDTDSWTGFISPGFSWPILNYGRLKNDVRVQDAAFQEAILGYQNSVLAAAQEVESSLASFIGGQEQVQHLAKSIESAKRSLDLSTIRYTEGSSTFTRVLNSQTQLRQVQTQLALAQGELATDLIAAHKALGGGWEIRAGMNILPEDTKAEMENRTDWGGMLDPGYSSGSDLGIPRHDPSRSENDDAGDTHQVPETPRK